MKPQHVRFNFLLQQHVMSLASRSYDVIQQLMKQYPTLKKFIGA